MNRILSILALLVLIGFLGILIIEVPRVDLTILVAITILLAAYDLIGSGGKRR